MARQQVEHVVEEADPGRDRRRAGAVEIDRDLDVGFLGGALDRAFAHALSRGLETRAFYQGLTAFATAVGGTGTHSPGMREPGAL